VKIGDLRRHSPRIQIRKGKVREKKTGGETNRSGWKGEDAKGRSAPQRNSLVVKLLGSMIGQALDGCRVKGMSLNGGGLNGKRSEEDDYAFCWLSETGETKEIVGSGGDRDQSKVWRWGGKRVEK